ncbi:hypothetical protein AB6A40_000437 [Gnathostoma spinigerum]|uniref:Transmembrane protein 134 n=1 Tax=Gnathostoma spinigerum TaxID=75299 RepID=A0ABD6E270_9BILA
MIPNVSGHQRNGSQVQQLIGDHETEAGEEKNGSEWKRTVRTSPPLPHSPGTSVENRLQGSSDHVTMLPVEDKREDPKLRDNIRVVVGSVVLTVLGSVLLVVGVLLFLVPHETGLRGWVFLFTGFLFFVPGIYHVIYILCTVMGRPGYSFSNLPTFNR